MRWTSMMKTSSRGVCCPYWLPVRLACSATARRECQYILLCKGNIHVIKFIYLRYLFSVFTFCPYAWQFDPRHTYDEHLILPSKPGVIEGELKNQQSLSQIWSGPTPSRACSLRFSLFGWYIHQRRASVNLKQTFVLLCDRCWRIMVSTTVIKDVSCLTGHQLCRCDTTNKYDQTHACELGSQLIKEAD
jgi:hypothetical protein